MIKRMRVATISFFIDDDADAFIGVEHGAEEAERETVRLPLEAIRSRNPAEVQRTIGRLVFAFLNARSEKGLNLPRDHEDENKLDEEHFNQLSLAAQTEAPEAIYDLATSLIAKGMNDGAWSSIEEGEKLLQKAVDIGFPAAIYYQNETWTLIRPRLEQRFKPKD